MIDPVEKAKPAAPLDAIALEDDLSRGVSAPGTAPAGDPAAVLPAKSQAELDAKEIKEWAGIPFLFGKIVARAMPELAEVYTREACMEWGEAMLPVARDMGWTGGKAMNWIGLGVVTWMLADPTIDAVKKRRAAVKAGAPDGAGNAAKPVST